MKTASARLFVLAGMPRTATTFLYQRFQEHPAIFCPYRKETNYFSVNYGKGADWYLKLYADQQAHQIGADVSPVYFLDEAAPDRIRSFHRAMPVILGVRPASEWALSWYTQVLSNHAGEKPDFDEFITRYTLRISGGEIQQDFRGGFVRRTIERFQECFGDNLLLYHYRTLKEDPLGLMNSIESFLGLNVHFTPENMSSEIVNAGTRRNIPLVADLLGREGFVDFVGRFVPRRLVQAARNLYVAAGTRKKATVPRPAFTDDELATAKAVFADDDAWIESVFTDSSIQVGASGAIKRASSVD